MDSRERVITRRSQQQPNSHELRIEDANGLTDASITHRCRFGSRTGTRRHRITSCSRWRRAATPTGRPSRNTTACDGARSRRVRIASFAQLGERGVLVSLALHRREMLIVLLIGCHSGSPRSRTANECVGVPTPELGLGPRPGGAFEAIDERITRMRMGVTRRGEGGRGPVAPMAAARGGGPDPQPPGPGPNLGKNQGLVSTLVTAQLTGEPLRRRAAPRTTRDDICARDCARMAVAPMDAVRPRTRGRVRLQDPRRPGGERPCPGRGQAFGTVLMWLMPVL